MVVSGYLVRNLILDALKFNTVSLPETGAEDLEETSRLSIFKLIAELTRNLNSNETS